MGNCRSCESRSTVTAKLVLLDGGLQEFSWPVKVSHLLQTNSDTFICSSEDMEFEKFVVEIGGDEVLRLGEVYFELPLGWLNHRLQVADMAALAVKASVACTASSSDDYMIRCCCWSRKVACTMLFNEKDKPLLAVDGGEKGGGSGCKRRKFVAKLSAIVELEE